MKKKISYFNLSLGVNQLHDQLTTIEQLLHEKRKEPKPNFRFQLVAKILYSISELASWLFHINGPSD